MSVLKRIKDFFLGGQHYTVKADEMCQIGVAKAGMGDTKTALWYLGKAIELDPGMAMAYYNRGLIYEHLNEAQKAVEDLLVAASFFEQNGDHKHASDARARLRELGLKHE